MKKIWLCVTCLTWILMTVVNDGFAYTTFKCGTLDLRWSSTPVTIRASQAGFPVGSVWRSALAQCVTRWNASPARFDFTQIYDDTSVGLRNGQNEVWWSSGFGAPAVTSLWYNTGTCRFVEADIRFDNTIAYGASSVKATLQPYGGASHSFQTACMHEYGHAVGLDHTANVYSVMGSSWNVLHANGATARAYVGEDAVHGDVRLYGLISGSLEDLGVAQWRWTGTSNGYSTHDRTRVFNSSGTLLGRVSGTREPTYCVSNGQTIQVEFTFENMGKTTQTRTIGYYLSSNDTISSGDRLFRTTSPQITRNTPYTVRQTITLPSNLVLGSNYWVGAIIDSSGSLPEISESNNATYVGIRRCW